MVIGTQPMTIVESGEHGHRFERFCLMDCFVNFRNARVRFFIHPVDRVDMILDRRVLDPDAIPEQLIERNKELNAISSALDPQFGAPRPVFLFGPSGAGKTTVATFALKEARRQLFDIQTAYVPCREQTRAGVLRDAVRGIVGGHRVYPSKGADALLDDLRTVDDRLIIVCDEADQLRDKQVLADLYHVDGCTLIVIGNREAELFAELETIQGGRSRFGQRETITFQKYDHETLVEILKARVDQGLRRGVVADEAIDAIAEHAAGDARQAVATLQRCVRDVVDGEQRVTVDVVEAVAPDAEAELRARQLGELSGDIRAVYDVVKGADVEDGLRTSEIYERYCDAVSDPVSKRTVTTYLGKLIEYGALEAHGRTRGRRYQPV